MTLEEVNVQCYHGRRKAEMPVEFGVEIMPTLYLQAKRQMSQERAAAKDTVFLKPIAGDISSPEYSGFKLFFFLNMH